jgi:N utilization substance protein B
LNTPHRPTSPRQARSVARLAAVQALYQMEASGIGVDAVVREFVDHRFETDIEGEPLAAADEVFFEALVRGVVDKQGEIDRAVVRRLAKGWKLERLDATTRAALRSGAYELIHRADVPVEVVIDEYVEIAKSFTDESGFLNAALDAIARDVRAFVPPGAVPPAPPKGG